MDYAKFNHHLKSLGTLEAIAYIEANFDEQALHADLCVRKARLILRALHDDLGDFEFSDAEHLLRRAIHIAPQLYEAHYELGIFYMTYEHQLVSSRHHLEIAKAQLQQDIQELETEFNDLEEFEDCETEE